MRGDNKWQKINWTRRKFNMKDIEAMSPNKWPWVRFNGKYRITNLLYLVNQRGPATATENSYNREWDFDLYHRQFNNH